MPDSPLPPAPLWATGDRVARAVAGVPPGGHGGRRVGRCEHGGHGSQGGAAAYFLRSRHALANRYRQSTLVCPFSTEYVRAVSPFR